MTVERKFELTCGYCKAVFMGTYKQRWNQQRGLTTPYCSPACRCRMAAKRNNIATAQVRRRQGATMTRVTHRFVRFYAPGSFVVNDWTQPVETLDPQAVQWPESAYAFTLHERVDVMDGSETFTGREQQVGPTYYHPDSKVMTAAEIAARDDSRDRILLANMRCNKWPSVIYSRWGNWPQPYDADKVQVLGAA